MKLFNWPAIALAAAVYLLSNKVKWTKKLHPIVFIGFSAVVGIVFRFGGV
jgi:chromate transporter